VPFVAIGDGGSIGAEWSKGGNFLYLSFGPSGDEGYWSANSGDEWEVDLAYPPDKFYEALEKLVAG
jgi:hypothetical protein